MLPPVTPASTPHSPLSTSYLQQLETVSITPRWRLMATREGHIEKAGVLRSIIEKFKGLIGYGDRTSQAAIEYELIRLIGNGAALGVFKEQDLNLIRTAAQKVGLVPGGTDGNAKHAELAAEIDAIADQLIKGKSLQPENFLKNASLYYILHRKELTPLAAAPEAHQRGQHATSASIVKAVSSTLNERLTAPAVNKAQVSVQGGTSPEAVAATPSPLSKGVSDEVPALSPNPVPVSKTLPFTATVINLPKGNPPIESWLDKLRSEQVNWNAGGDFPLTNCFRQLCKKERPVSGEEDLLGLCVEKILVLAEGIEPEQRQEAELLLDGLVESFGFTNAVALLAAGYKLSNYLKTVGNTEEKALSANASVLFEQHLKKIVTEHPDDYDEINLSRLRFDQATVPEAFHQELISTEQTAGRWNLITGVFYGALLGLAAFGGASLNAARNNNPEFRGALTLPAGNAFVPQPITPIAPLELSAYAHPSFPKWQGNLPSALGNFRVPPPNPSESDDSVALTLWQGDAPVCTIKELPKGAPIYFEQEDVFLPEDVATSFGDQYLLSDTPANSETTPAIDTPSVVPETVDQPDSLPSSNGLGKIHAFALGSLAAISGIFIWLRKQPVRVSAGKQEEETPPPIPSLRPAQRTQPPETEVTLAQKVDNEHKRLMEAGLLQEAKDWRTRFPQFFESTPPAKKKEDALTIGGSQIRPINIPKGYRMGMEGDLYPIPAEPPRAVPSEEVEAFNDVHASSSRGAIPESEIAKTSGEGTGGVQSNPAGDLQENIPPAVILQSDSAITRDTGPPNASPAGVNQLVPPPPLPVASAPQAASGYSYFWRAATAPLAIASFAGGAASNAAHSVRVMTNTAAAWMRGTFFSLPAIGIHPDPIIQAARTRTVNPGTMLSSQDIQSFLDGLRSNRQFNVVNSFFHRNIDSFKISGIRSVIDEAIKAGEITPGKPICIPITFSNERGGLFERNHIAVILIQGDTVEYYDSKSADLAATDPHNELIIDTLDYCRKKFTTNVPGMSRTLMNYSRHQLDAHNCGVFVCRHIYRRLIDQKPYAVDDSAVPTNEELDSFRRKICEIAYPLPNEAAIEMLSGDYRQLKKDFHRVGQITIRSAKGISDLNFNKQDPGAIDVVKATIQEALNRQLSGRQSLKVKDVETLMLLFTQTLLAQSTEKITTDQQTIDLADPRKKGWFESELKTAKERDERFRQRNPTAEQRPTVVSTNAVTAEGQYITVEVDKHLNLLIVENKAIYKITDNTVDNLPLIGYKIAKRTVSIPIPTLKDVAHKKSQQTAIPQSDPDWHDVKVVDWTSETLPPTIDRSALDARRQQF